MFKQENKSQPREAETIIGPSVMVKGNLNSNGNIVIEGILKGGVKTAGEIFVGDKAQIIADVEAKTARIGGDVKGNIKIEGYLHISSTAKILGDIECASLAIEQGAIINGKCSMGNKEVLEKNKQVEEKGIDKEQNEE